MSLDQFQAAVGATRENAELYFETVMQAMDRFSILDELEPTAAFLATISIESARLTTVEENLYYRSPERLHQIFPSKFPDIDSARPYCRMPKELSKKLYNGYHGRGLIQLTWERNYRIHGERLGVGDSLVVYPDTLLTPDWAALTAASYWDLHNCNSCSNDMGEVTRRVNGPARMHLAERIAQMNVAMEVLA
jgi:putative chitinase